MSGRDLSKLRFRFLALGLLGLVAVATFVLGAATAAPGPLQYSNQGATTTDYTPLYIGLAVVAVVAVIVGLLVMMRGRRSQSPPPEDDMAPPMAGPAMAPTYQAPPGDDGTTGPYSDAPPPS